MMADTSKMDLLEATVEVTKAALPLASGTWLSQPEKVAAFMDVVYRKLKQLEQERYT
jgi:hypothetical protein